MAKLTNIRERVQQPFRDSLVRTAGLAPGTLSDRSQLFQANNNRKTIGDTNLQGNGQLQSDNSMIVLALRVSIFARAGNYRTPLGNPSYVTRNGDFGNNPNLAGGLAAGNGESTTLDVWRLCWQIAESIFWTFGAGLKPSIQSMPSTYFPAGAGLDVAFGGQSDLIHVGNGSPTHQAMLKLARAILLVPRQAISCEAVAQKFEDGGAAASWLTVQNGRNMLSVTDNLNAADGIAKSVSICFDGLLSRDVQLARFDGEKRRFFPRQRRLGNGQARAKAVRLPVFFVCDCPGHVRPCSPPSELVPP